MNLRAAAIVGIWMVCGGAIGVQADTSTTTAGSAAVDSVLASAPDSTQIEAPVALAGQWRAAGTEEEEEQRLKAVDEVTKKMGRFKRGKARGRLKDLTSPPLTVRLEITDSTATITSDDKRIELALGKAPVEMEGSEEESKISATLVDEELVVETQGDKGGRTVKYQTSGDNLLMKVTMTGEILEGPLTYVATYTRVK